MKKLAKEEKQLDIVTLFGRYNNGRLRQAVSGALNFEADVEAYTAFVKGDRAKLEELVAQFTGAEIKPFKSKAKKTEAVTVWNKLYEVNFEKRDGISA